MKLKCIECGEIIDTKSKKFQLIKIGNSWKCVRCRGYKFIIEELD